MEYASYCSKLIHAYMNDKCIIQREKISNSNSKKGGSTVDKKHKTAEIGIRFSIGHIRQGRCNVLETRIIEHQCKCREL